MNDNPDIDEDTLLLDRALAGPEGDTRAFEALVHRHRERVIANCRYISRSPGDAEDLAQEVFVKAYFSLRRFERRSRFRTWLQRIKVNHCLNYLKKTAGRSFSDLEGVELSAEMTTNRIDAEDERERIADVLDGMSDSLRIPLILRDMDQMPYQEIADALGIGLSAVKMRIKRAREEFRKAYAAGV